MDLPTADRDIPSRRPAAENPPESAQTKKIDASVSVCMSVNNSLVCWGLEKYGTEAQKQKYLPPLARGELIGCFGLTEPDHGSDPGSMVTRARSTSGGFHLTGSKTWISNSPFADVFVVWAKTDDDVIRGFILEKGWKGLSAPVLRGKVGLRASTTGQIVMDNVFVPEENLLPGGYQLSSRVCLNPFPLSWTYFPPWGLVPLLTTSITNA